MKYQIDVRSTRKHVRADVYARNSALYAQYQVISKEIDPTTEREVSVVLQMKPEFVAKLNEGRKAMPAPIQP